MEADEVINFHTTQDFSTYIEVISSLIVEEHGITGENHGHRQTIQQFFSKKLLSWPNLNQNDERHCDPLARALYHSTTDSRDLEY